MNFKTTTNQCLVAVCEAGVYNQLAIMLCSLNSRADIDRRSMTRVEVSELAKQLDELLLQFELVTPGELTRKVAA